MANILKFYIGSSAFVKRARRHLADFDEQRNAEALFHAALAVRMGIEARLYEYLETELKHIGISRAESKIKHHRADRLLKELAELNPATEKPLTVTLRRNDGARTVFEYRPVTKALERAHGRMGALLHYSLFWQNPEWYVIDRSRRGSFDTLLDARDVVTEALEELTYVTRSSLLAHPTVSRRVIELEQEAAKESVSEKDAPGFS
jgi:hypothetical protein